MFKNPMFLLLWLPSVGALVLAGLKLSRRDWVPAGMLLVIGVGVILASGWMLRELNQLEIPIEEARSGAAMAARAGPIVMQLSGGVVGNTLFWALGFLVGAIALVENPGVLWRWWISYPAALVLLVLTVVASVLAMNEKLQRIVADANGVEVKTESRVISIPGTKVAWQEVVAVKQVEVRSRKVSKSPATTTVTRREFVLLGRDGTELLNLEEPLAPPQAYQRFLDSIPEWTGLAIQQERVTR